MNASDFRPVYDDTVYESLPGMVDANGNPVDTRWAINPQYCLTVMSAKLLACLFDPAKNPQSQLKLPTIKMLPPVPQASGSPYTFNHNVPWLDFGAGTIRNAGELAGYWESPSGNPMPGVGYNGAFGEAQIDVQTPVEGQ